MDDNTHTVILHMNEELDGLEKLRFTYTDEGFSFNVMDDGDTEAASRLTYNVTSRECIFDTLDSTDNELNEEIVATYMEGNSDYIIVTDNYTDIPIFESFGINYIVSCNMDLQQKHIDAINKVSVCLTTVTGLATEYKAIHTTIVPLDFSNLSSQVTTTTPLFDITVAIQKEEKDGLEAINKHLYTCYKDSIESNTDNNVSSAYGGVTVEDEVLPESQEVANHPVSNETQSAPKKNITALNIAELVADPKYQQRVGEDKSAIDDLATAYRNAEAIPPIDVVNIDGKNFIVDGFHRFFGAQKAGITSLQCHVEVATEEQALIKSLGANSKNLALKRTNDDKRKAVTTALTCRDFNSKSNREIAAICKVSPGLVDKVAKELEAQKTVPSTSAYISSDKTKEIPINSSDSEVSAYIGSDKTDHTQPNAKDLKNISKKISNKFVSLSLTVKEPSNEIAFNNLLADLNDVIDSYASELGEVN